MTAPLPDALSIINCDALARSSKSVHDFAREKLKIILEKAHATEDYLDKIKLLDESAKIVTLRAAYREEISNKTWTAAATQADLENIKPNAINYLDVPAMEGLAALNQQLGANQKISNIGMAYYVSNEGVLNRGYVVNDLLLDGANTDHQKMTDILDQMFHSWLISHNMASDENGVIHHRTKDGVLGDPISGEVVNQLLMDPTTGFESTVYKIDPSIQLTMTWSPPEPEQPSAGPETAAPSEQTVRQKK